MAYYNSSGSYYESTSGEYYHETPYYSSSYEIVPFEDSTDSISYSGYELSQPNFIEYDPIPTPYPYPLTQSDVSYSAHRFSEPTLIEYYPNHSYGYLNYLSSETQQAVSYSETLDFNEPDFPEYDPTPYGGGYDQNLTYGKPLPASNEICYPRSLPGPNGLVSDGFSYGSIPSPYGGGDDLVGSSAKPREESKPVKPVEEEKKFHDGNRDHGHHDNDHETVVERHLDSSIGERTEKYGNGYGYGPYGYGYGYGLEAMDLCESLFGYWPCLSKNRRNHCHQVAEEDSQENQWRSAADYLFGSPYGYGKQREEGSVVGGPTPAYSQVQSYPQFEGDESSWCQYFNKY